MSRTGTRVIDEDPGKGLRQWGVFQMEPVRADGAATRWIELRERAIDRLAGVLQVHSVKSIAWGNEIRESFSDFALY